jgi:hypothetical protein
VPALFQFGPNASSGVGVARSEVLLGLPEVRDRFPVLEDVECFLHEFILVDYYRLLLNIHVCEWESSSCDGGDWMARPSVDIGPEELDRTPDIREAESIQETVSAAARTAAVRALASLGESGALDFLLEAGAEERLWG